MLAAHSYAVEQLECRLLLHGIDGGADWDRAPGQKAVAATGIKPINWYQPTNIVTLPSSLVQTAFAVGNSSNFYPTDNYTAAESTASRTALKKALNQLNATASNAKVKTTRYVPPKSNAGKSAASSGMLADLPGPSASTTPVASPTTFTTNAAGLPLLSSRTDGAGLKIFLDFDGYGTDTPFTIDSDSTTFNAQEQAVIYTCWRDIASTYSMLNVNVTTIQPPTGGSNPVFVWQRIIGNMSGGAAYVGWLTNNSSQGYDNSGDAISRHSGIDHEIGHQLSLNHQSSYDNYGNKTAEYIPNPDSTHGVIMGIDYDGYTKKFIDGRDALASDNFQADLDQMSSFIVSTGVVSAGYRPDDFTGTSTSTATALSLMNGAYQTAGVIEQISDADYFSFTSTGQNFDINVEPTFMSPLAPKLDVYNSSGTLIAAKDDTLYRGGLDNASEDVTLNLPAGAYYAKVSSSGNYGDQGEYAFYASPLPSTNWSSQDINAGNTGRGGYVTYDSSSGTFYEGGSGADIWNATDSPRFTYEQLTGDGSITAKLLSVDNTSSVAKAGVMIRQSLTANSAQAYIGIVPSGNVESIWRSAAGASAANVAATAAGGPWVRLSRAGNVFTYQKSTDGSTWTTVGTTTISMTGPVYIGLAVCAQTIYAQASAVISNVTLTGTLGPTTPTYNGLTAPSNLTATDATTQSTAVNLSWTGSTGATGYSVERSLDGVNFTQLTTTGSTTYTDPTGGWGSIRYWYRVTATNATGSSVYSNIANAVNKPGQPYGAQAIALGTGELSLTWRDVAGDSGYRIERSSDGGTTYTTLGTNAQNIITYNSTGLTAGTTYTYRITPTSAVGDGVPLIFSATTLLAATSSLTLTNLTTTAGLLTWSQVTNATGYQIYRSTDNATFSLVNTINSGTTLTYTDTGLSPLTNYYYYIVAFNASQTGVASSHAFGSTLASPAIPSPWAQADIGAVSGSGAASISPANGTSTINTSGQDIAGTADSFHFLYAPLTTDATVVAQITSLGTSATAAKAGIMIRGSLAAGSRFAGIFMNSGNGYGIDTRVRTTDNANYTYHQALASVVAPYWLKLTRVGTTIAAYYSTDGSTWTLASTFSVSTTGTYYAGIAATASSTTAMNAATFTNVSITTSAPTIATAASATPSPVTGTTSNLSVLGADSGGESSLSYTWATTGTPPAAVNFSANGTNAAKNTVATFTAAGTYSFKVTVSDPLGASTSSNITVAVNQTPTTVTALSPTIPAGTSIQVNVADQFGNAISTGAVTFSSSVGSVSSAGVFNAPATGASSATVTATVGSFSGNATIAITPAVAWYRADESSGTTLSDSSGNGKNGTVSGSASFGTGEIANALTLSGGYAALPANLVSSLTNFTISGWVNQTSVNNWARLFDFGSSTTKYMFVAPSAGDGYLRFAITTSGGSGEQQVTTTSALTAGNWYFIAVTLSGSTATLYLNGTAVGTNTSMTLNPSSLGSTSNDWIGKSQYSDPNLAGAVDDFRIYGAAASAASIASMYAVGAASASHTPTVATSAAVSPSPVTGTSATLSALGTESAGESNLTYTWLMTSGPATVTYSANGTNAAKSSTVTFTKAGTYNFKVTIADPVGSSVTSTTSVVVNQTPTTVNVTPASGPTLVIGGTQQFSATATDQFGNGIASPSIAWTATGGTVDNTGLFTAGQSSGSYSVTATAGAAARSATGSITLPSWLGANSVATWNPSTRALTVTGAASIIADPGTDEPIVQASGAAAVLTLSTPSSLQIHLGGLSLTNGASASVTSLGAARSSSNYRVLVIGVPNSAATPLYTIDSTSKLDLTDNDMAVLYGSGTSVQSAIVSQLSQAYDGKLWDQPGLTSSMAAANANSYALGYAESSALGLTSFDGQTLGSNAVLVKYTLRGDTDLSGGVQLSDYTNVVLNMGSATGNWMQGAFDYDGNVGLGDYSSVVMNLGQSM